MEEKTEKIWNNGYRAGIEESDAIVLRLHGIIKELQKDLSDREGKQCDVLRCVYAFSGGYNFTGDSEK